MVLNSEKKYLCLLCGMIIDNPDYCEYCGATSENIVPYNEEQALNFVDREGG